MMRNERSARRNSLISFAVPVAVAVIILVVIVRALFSSSDDSASRAGNDSVNVVPKSENSEVFIYMSGDSKKQIEGEEKMFPTDNRLEVKSGDAEIVLTNSPSKIYADRLTEVAYKGK